VSYRTEVVFRSVIALGDLVRPGEKGWRFVETVLTIPVFFFHLGVASCANGLYCDGTTLKCNHDKKIGEACTGNKEYVSNFRLASHGLNLELVLSEKTIPGATLVLISFWAM
jgi:hypothetical protein